MYECVLCMYYFVTLISTTDVLLLKKICLIIAQTFVIKKILIIYQKYENTYHKNIKI